MKWILREQQRIESNYNAGSKARDDVDRILVVEGYKPLVPNLELDTSENLLKKIVLQFTRYNKWKKTIIQTSKDDIVVIQYPLRNHTLFFSLVLRKMKKKGIKTVGVIHDLECLRQAIDSEIPITSKLRFYLEETSALKSFSTIIVHNEHMKKAISEIMHIPSTSMVNLEIFDYLYTPEAKVDKAVFGGAVVIAGSLDKNKAGYIYRLPKNVPFDLFGANLDESFQFHPNVNYKGKVKPDILPSLLKGSFGLVWDGQSAETCAGVFGEYLKINNPHKTSLYLASGLPVIVWRQSAMADFVRDHNCGLEIDSLEELSEINKLTEDEYCLMKNNANKIGAMIRSGYFLRKAIRASYEVIE